MVAMVCMRPPNISMRSHMFMTLDETDGTAARGIADVKLTNGEFQGRVYPTNMQSQPVPQSLESAASAYGWPNLLKSEAKYTRLRDLSLVVSVRRTVDEAELALKLEDEFGADPTIIADIDFSLLARRVERDLRENGPEVVRSKLLEPKELQALKARQERALRRLKSVGSAPAVQAPAADGTLAEAIPKIRRVIAQARELPLTIEVPPSMDTTEARSNLGTGSEEPASGEQPTSVVAAVQEVFRRLSGADEVRLAELVALAKEAEALLALRTEATKLRSGFRLVQRQKDFKSASLVRFGASASLLTEMLLADGSIAKMQKELSLKAASLQLYASSHGLNPPAFTRHASEKPV